MAIRQQYYERRIDGKTKDIILHDVSMLIESSTLEFLVIHYLGLSPKIKKTDGEREIDYKGFVQLMINTTMYFDGLGNGGSSGISNLAVSFPPDKGDSLDVYLLPGQRMAIWLMMGARDVKSESGRALDGDEYIDFCMKYTKFDGTDSILANQLLEMGISVSSREINWLKRRLIDQESGRVTTEIEHRRGTF